MSGAGWIAVAGYEEVPEDGTLASRMEDVSVCLYKVEGEIYATDNQCTHGDAELSEGLIQDGCLIECPLHEGMFDIRTGKAVSPPCTRDIRSYEAKVEGAVIYLRTSARAT
ncbi:Naphthalene 1,2-dioxygenase/salicylate 5-hydroxylase systems, ferredoxin component [Pigmentiphaga humi]|uniref:Naphthalene 1,2-dioxygenase/salicylate 5-hydroxylase systems, ferredoxin component n=1 Tax=Pigmentiphaga humi TaxID=2478468 RepID=A0A3P4B3L2_9BURK|nr:non-heme iron oxygenase ferredoxin subunit [Pigmentiphaga humi]VCU70879.1 Naphthalene 1,2-dioxygenase/salicylate 5-hydroxylase systems, ferredoxin component [Pigmentiphaga humi]